MLLTSVQCLVDYVNDVLPEVFPHSTDPTGDGNTYTVRGALGLLEAHDIRAFGGEQATATPPSQCTATDVGSLDPAMCPRSETQLVTGKGVYAYPDCNWAGTTTENGRYRHLIPYATPTQPHATIPDEDTPIDEASRDRRRRGGWGQVSERVPMGRFTWRLSRQFITEFANVNIIPRIGRVWVRRGYFRLANSS